MVALGALVALVGADAAPAKLEHLGQPCRAKNILASRIVTDRSTGREMLVLSNTNEASNVELIFVDFERDTGRLYRAPAGQGAWALMEVPGDRLVVGTYYDGVFMIFDLKKMEFAKVAKFPGESYIWNLATGSDGRIYGGTYGGAKLGALDLTTYQVEDCGAPAPPNMYLRYVSALPDGRILCSFGMEKPNTLIYDPATKKFDPVPKQIEGVTSGISWDGYFIVGSRLLKGGALEEAGPPFPTPPAEKGGWSVSPNWSSDGRLYFRQGSTVYRWARGEKDLEFVATLDSRAGGIVAASKAGELLGVRGQDYFVVKPGETEVRLRPIPVESAPRATHFLRCAPDGRLWGGAMFGQTLFWLDPRTKKYVNTANVCDAGGEVCDTAFRDGKVYAVAYAGGDIIEYDPNAPWDQWNHKNPRVIGDVGDRGYIRPTGGIVVGPDGKLYSGWMAGYGTYGGAVAITDLAAGTTDIIENPLGQQTIAGVVVDDRFAYVGTSLGANGLPNKKGEPAKLGVIDLATRKPVFEQTLDGVSNVRPIARDAKTQRVLVSAGKWLLFDTAGRKFLTDVLADAPGLGCNSVGVTPYGVVYYANDKSILKLDMQVGKVAQVAEAPAKVSNVAVAPDGTVYVSCGVDVYMLRVER